MDFEDMDAKIKANSIHVAVFCSPHKRFMLQAKHLIWQDGRMFLHPCAIRMNLALPLIRVQEAFDRLDKYVFNADK